LRPCHRAGVTPEQPAPIFERFRQGHERIRDAHDGAGLGLALSRTLAGLMGRTLTVQSTPRQGARFGLSLPRRA
jgi:signal transduction histidine kinase